MKPDYIDKALANESDASQRGEPVRLVCMFEITHYIDADEFNDEDLHELCISYTNTIADYLSPSVDGVDVESIHVEERE